MDIYHKLPDDLKNIVKLYLYKYLDNHYINKIIKYFYFNDILKSKVKKNFSLIKNSDNSHFCFPYKIADFCKNLIIRCFLR